MLDYIRVHSQCSDLAPLCECISLCCRIHMLTISMLQLNTDIGGTSDYVYLIVNDLGDDGESGLQFINGMTFLERFYFVYDVGSSQVGFATTSYTDATTN